MAARHPDRPRRGLAGRRRTAAPAVHVRPGLREPGPDARLHGQPGRGHRPGDGLHPAGPARPGRLERRVRGHPAAARRRAAVAAARCGRRWPRASPGRWACGGSARGWAACSAARPARSPARPGRSSCTRCWPCWPGPRRAGRRAAGSVAAGSPLGLTGARVAWLALWGSFAYFILQAANRAPGALHDTIAGLAAGEPGWVAAMDRAVASAAGSHGTVISIVPRGGLRCGGPGGVLGGHHAGRAGAQRDHGRGDLGARGELRRAS